MCFLPYCGLQKNVNKFLLSFLYVTDAKHAQNHVDSTSTWRPPLRDLILPVLNKLYWVTLNPTTITSSSWTCMQQPDTDCQNTNTLIDHISFLWFLINAIYKHNLISWRIAAMMWSLEYEIIPFLLRSHFKPSKLGYTTCSSRMVQPPHHLVMILNKLHMLWYAIN